MSLATQPAESDLWLPVPQGADWPTHTVHTHYFGFSIPEAGIGVFIYVRSQPVMALCSGGVCIFRGLDNYKPLDIEHLNFLNTMPYPVFENRVFETANGLRVDFLEAGRQVRLSYASRDRGTRFDVTQTAVTPLLARGHVMPGEDRDSDSANSPGGSEQFMHCVGELVLDGATHAIDCLAARDRSWRQVRTEDEVEFPPVGWSPIYFGDDLSFNQVGYVAPETDPPWRDLFNLPADRPSHYYAWIIVDGRTRAIRRVRRSVQDYHPQLFAAIRQEIEAEDETGRVHRFRGEAIAMAQLPSWPNNIFIDSVYRWQDERGRIAHCTYQETWYHKFQRHMHRRALQPEPVSA